MGEFSCFSFFLHPLSLRFYFDSLESKSRILEVGRGREEEFKPCVGSLMFRELLESFDFSRLDSRE